MRNTENNEISAEAFRPKNDRERWAGRPQAWYDARVAYLSGFMTPEREGTLRRVAEMRTRYLTFCTENTFHPQNASALLRSAEAFGLQDVHAVENLCKFRPNTRIVRGTDQWLDLHRHASTAGALADLRRRGYRIVATMPHAGDRTPETLDVESGPLALVFGTEHAGISREVIEAADDFVRIPMCGFVESLNVSASAAVLLHVLTQRIRACGAQWRIGERERAELLFRWMMASVRDSERILSRFAENE